MDGMYNFTVSAKKKEASTAKVIYRVDNLNE